MTPEETQQFFHIMSIIMYFPIGFVAYVILVHGIGWFRGVEDFWRNFRDWQRAYNQRTSTSREDRSYPDLRRTEHREADLVMQQFIAALIPFFWPVFVMFAVARGVYKMFKALFVIFSNAFKIIDSLKGE